MHLTNLKHIYRKVCLLSCSAVCSQVLDGRGPSALTANDFPGGRSTELGLYLQLTGGAVPAAMLVFVRLPEREVIYSCCALRGFERCVELYGLCRFPSVFSCVLCTMMASELESYGSS